MCWDDSTLISAEQPMLLEHKLRHKARAKVYEIYSLLHCTGAKGLHGMADLTSPIHAITNQWDKCRLTSISFNFSRIAVSFCWFLKNKSLMSISMMIDQRYNYFYQRADLSTTSCYTQLHGPRQSADLKNCLWLVLKTDKTVLALEQLTA